MPTKKDEKLQPFCPLSNVGKRFVTGERSDFSLQKMPHPEVVFIGDSITEYWCAEHPDFFRRNNFSARGVCGETSLNILQRFQTDAADVGAPIVVLLCGINDFAEPASSQVEVDAVRNITAMCDEAFLSGTTLIISALTPCIAIPWAPHIPHLSERIIKLNSLLYTLSHHRHLPFADYHSAMALPDGGMRPEFTNDGCHPNAEGFCRMESVIVRQIELLTNRLNTYFVTPPKTNFAL